MGSQGWERACERSVAHMPQPTCNEALAIAVPAQLRHVPRRRRGDVLGVDNAHTLVAGGEGVA